MKVWFITGASRGIGVPVAERVPAAAGLIVRTARRPEKMFARFGEQPCLLAVALDVTNEGQAENAAKAMVARFGRIDVPLNNCGYGLLGAVEKASRDEVEGAFRTNVFGLLDVSRAVLPYMRRQRPGLSPSRPISSP